jgi:AP-3 complex subunit delta-1
MFEKTLTDVVKGIRASKRDTALYISQCIAEIKQEINSADMFVKANALQKLTFLQMMGYSMTWASFATIEVMSSPRFAHKRIGYLAASQGFTQDTEVILLTTNLLKKELRGSVGTSMNGVYEAGLAINCISNIVTQDLARDLLPELTLLTSHPQPYLRKKAILCLYKVFCQYPQGLRLTFPKLQQCLSDMNPSVVSCAVNVITELSDKNPKNYLSLAPAFFDLLTTSSNNWMLIKVVKLLGSLVPEEPRLARKLLEPLAAIVKTTAAKSLLYEAVYTITLCLPRCAKSDGSLPANTTDIVTLCAQTLRGLVGDADQNLKYLGLVGFGSLMQSHPRVLSHVEYRPLVLACLSDPDITIRTRALDLLGGMASRNNLVELITQLLRHVQTATGAYRSSLVLKIVQLCSAQKYALLPDFAWYLDVLFQLGRMRNIEAHGDLLRAQIADVALRVVPVRVYAVRRSMETLLREGDSHNTAADDLCGDNGRGKNLMTQVLPALAWIIGEYSDLIREAVNSETTNDNNYKGHGEFVYDDRSKGRYHALFQMLTAPWNVQKLPSETQKVYIQAAMKVFAAATADSIVTSAELKAIVRTIESNVPIYMQSPDAEVAERAFTTLELLRSLNLRSVDSTPGLVSTSDDGSESGGDEDLIGMPGGGHSLIKTPPDSVLSLDKRIRAASSLLNGLLKPSPMKPVGSKAQRKKRTSPNGLSIDLEAPADLSVFEDLISDEESYRNSNKLSIESVSFTQQHLMQVQEAPITSLSSGPIGERVPIPMPGIGSSSLGGMGSMNSNNHGASSSFQHQANPSSPMALQNVRQSDPFYLNSTPAPSDAQAQNDSKFGVIELLDSDDDRRGSANKKEKKPKRKKKQSSSLNNGTEDGFISFENTSSFKGAAGTAAQVGVIHSSDDEDEKPGMLVVGRQKGHSKHHNSGLAKVDLTTPLRDDEIMPERKHRVVPDRPVESCVPIEKEKQSKRNKKKSKNESRTSTNNGVGDLLDLGGFGQAQTNDSNFFNSIAPSTVMNPINSAFDDLLGFSNPTPAPQLGAYLAPVATSHISPLWMRASLKHSSASGTPTADWSRMELLYRVHQANDGYFLVLSFRNNDRFEVTGLTLQLKVLQQTCSLEDVGPGMSVESKPLGPFTLAVDASMDVKGRLSTASDFMISFACSLPATIHLNPATQLTMDGVADELASVTWSSHTMKLPYTVVPGVGIQTLLTQFLNAGVVADAGSPYVLAATSVSGARVRVLVKERPGSIKIDIKCTNAGLGKALASDLKRLVL